MSLLAGFVKAQSDNLPKIDTITLFSFLGSNRDFMGAEIRGFKTHRSGREDYGDNAIGYVQVKRDKDICIVNAQITPEHSTRKKAYDVTLQCDEAKEEILSVQCNDCAASLGGCKHSIALLTWLHRRSEEPSVTSVSCYWKQSKLSTVGKSLKCIKAKDIGGRNVEPLPLPDGSFRKKVVERSKSFGRKDTVLTKYFQEITGRKKISVHVLLIDFFEKKREATAAEFIIHCSAEMSEDVCLEVENETLQQSQCNFWHELRYGRITASRAHEAAHCSTLEGSLVESILGANSIKDTAAMARGRRLENLVRQELEKQKNIKIQQCGFKTSPQYPIMGASPDGISENFVIEIKCPTSEKAMKRYTCSANKYFTQVQLQMLFFKRQQGLFCIAHPDFESSKKISVLVIDFNQQYCAALISASHFGKKQYFH